jgi:hypothetical protein
LPHGESHDGSPGFAAFHRAKSDELRFSLVSKFASLSDARVALPTDVGLHLPYTWPASLNFAVSKYTLLLLSYAMPLAMMPCKKISDGTEL